MPRPIVKRHASAASPSLPGKPPDDRRLLSCRAWTATRCPRPLGRRRPIAAPIEATWLGRVPYREAWALQKQLAARRADGAIGDRLLLLEHPAVLTLGRHADDRHVLADAAELKPTGDRGDPGRAWRRGDLPRPGPAGRLPDPRPRRPRPAAPAARAGARGGDGRRRARRSASTRVVATAIPAAGATPRARRHARSARSGIRVERGVSYHGIALNVAPDLADFDLIDPCGVPGLASTSIAAELRRAGADDGPAVSESAVRPGGRGVRPGPRRAARCATLLGVAADPWPRRPDAMAAGLFELRKDPITGWWVATVVDRAFHRDRFAHAALRIDDRGDCQNCRLPAGHGIRMRMLKDFAFHVVGTDEESREIDGAMAQVALSQARASGSWRTIVAPPGEHRPLHAVGNEIIEGLSKRPATRSPRPGRPARPTISSSSRTGAPRPAPGRTTSASTCTTCRRSRTGSPRSWAARPGS